MTYVREVGLRTLGECFLGRAGETRPEGPNRGSEGSEQRV